MWRRLPHTHGARTLLTLVTTWPLALWGLGDRPDERESLRDPRRNANTIPCSYVGKRETWTHSPPVVDHEILLESISRLFCSSEALLDTWPQDEPFSTPENTYLRWTRTGESILILMSEEKGWIETATVHQRWGVPCPTSSPALPRTQLTDLSALPADLSEASLPISCHSDLLACDSSGFCSFYCL